MAWKISILSSLTRLYSHNSLSREVPGRYMIRFVLAINTISFLSDNSQDLLVMSTSTIQKIGSKAYKFAKNCCSFLSQISETDYNSSFLFQWKPHHYPSSPSRSQTFLMLKLRIGHNHQQLFVVHKNVLVS